MRVLADLSLLARRMRRRPWRSLLALLLVTVPLTASLLVFAAVDDVLFRDLPYRRPDQLFQLVQADSGRGTASTVPTTDVLKFAELNLPVALFGPGPPLLVDGPRYGAQSVTVALITSSFFDVLGSGPEVGGIPPSTNLVGAGETSIIVSRSFLSEVLGGDSGAVGTTIHSDRGLLRVAGVLGPQFVFPWAAHPQPDFLISVHAEALPERAFGIVRLLRPQSETRLVDAGFSTTPLRSFLLARFRNVSLALSLGACLLLCLTVATITIVREGERTTDTLIDTLCVSLGATRPALRMARILRDAFVGFIAVVSAVVITGSLHPLILEQIVSIGLVSTRPASALRWFTLAMLLLLGVIGLGEILRRGVRSLRARATSEHLSTQLAMSVLGVQLSVAVAIFVTALVAGRSLLTQSVRSLGYNPTGIYSLDFQMPARYLSDPALKRSFYDGIIHRLQQNLGQTNVAAADVLPTVGAFPERTVAGPPTGGRTDRGALWRISQDFLQLLGVSIEHGRSLSGTIADGSEECLLDFRAMRRLFGDAPPAQVIGLPVQIGPANCIVVGVMTGFRETTMPWNVYMNLEVAKARRLTIVVRPASTMPAPAENLRRWVSAFDSAVAAQPRSLEKSLLSGPLSVRSGAFMFACGSVISIGLVACSVLAVTTNIIAMRRRRLAIEIALGASPSGLIVKLMVRLLAVSILAVGVGMAAAAILLGLLRSHVESLGHMHVGDVLISSSIAFGAMVVAAAWPARQLWYLDPASLLRN